MKSGVLYISYDGLLEPLGQSQVLAYIERLADGYPLHLISFEKEVDWRVLEERARVEGRLTAAGIRWHPLRYHKRPSSLATAWDIMNGARLGASLVYRHKLQIVHARSYVASVMALMIKRLVGAKFVFDMRGFWADERVDGGLWQGDSRMYRAAKWFERQFLVDADHVVSLTEAAKSEVRDFPYLKRRMPAISVIPTCADLQRFRPISKVPRLDDFVLGYVGSAGTWYQFEAVARAFGLLCEKRPGVRLLVVNRHQHDYIRGALAEAGIDLARVTIVAANHDEVPGLMAGMNAGIFFYRPSYSRLACAPTKLGEFLGCGVPCLSNSGVGDMAAVLEGDRVGVAVSSFVDSDLSTGIDRLLKLCDEPNIVDRCVAAAHRHFSLDIGLARYDEIYRSLTAEKMPA